jgi:hypothetical protein
MHDQRGILLLCQGLTHLCQLEADEHVQSIPSYCNHNRDRRKYNLSSVSKRNSVLLILNFQNSFSDLRASVKKEDEQEKPHYLMVRVYLILAHCFVYVGQSPEVNYTA